MSGCFVTGDYQSITAKLGRISCMLRYGNGAYYRTAIVMHLVNKPGFTQRIVDDRNFLLDSHLDVLFGIGTDQNLVDAKRFIRQLPCFPDQLAGFFGCAACNRQYTQATGIAYCSNQVRFCDPVHARQHDGVLYPKKLGHACFQHK